MMTHRPADRSDSSLLRQLIRSPTATIVALAEATGLARNTVRARLDRYERDGVLRSLERRIDPAFLGYPLGAYIVTRVTQRKLDSVGAALAGIPEVVEVLGLSGVTDLLIRVAARDAEDLYRIAGRILDVDGVKRTSTGLVMREMVPYRVEQLL
ncbi:Lrp/AsnC family transcriptional regulator [Microbacterium capsulatum]|uniref:Lrp/AsnC family transcriptional regulator n=1 Tax=Microbacterium capsulatum TaxID=3041921 RepID=A0ABU0XGV8_9MICO|nr:Lrp/AsnC family transcriptional regulator [Microbacterium sp. ASV81]MDQ4214351.1 Lrp/AsnC family transcriptional regulator [Microbacterium sp. ASV81]